MPSADPAEPGPEQHGAAGAGHIREDLHVQVLGDDHLDPSQAGVDAHRATVQGPTTFSGALRAATATVEDAHGIAVDVVTVGDCDLDGTLRPAVAAAREAVTNAAKHAGTGQVDVYAEVSPSAGEVFVRHRGRGFDPERTPGDRRGVRDSVIGRMERHGGTAEIRSTADTGTEVRLRLPRRQPADLPGGP